MYGVIFSAKASKYLLRLPKAWQVRIREKIDYLAENPYAKNNNVKKLSGCDEYRLRIGDFRVIYSINNNILTIDIVDIGPRGGIYQ